MIELFECPPTRSQRVRWALEEVGADYETRMVDLNKGEQDSAEYRAIHPLGVVPAIKTDGYTLIESIAIVLQLIDEHPASNLAPPLGSAERALYYQWSVFAAAELDPALMMYFDNSMRPLEGMRPPGRQLNAEFASYGRYNFKARATILSNILKDREHLLESRFSAADIIIGHSCYMAEHMGLIGPFPVLSAYHERLQNREAYKRAYAQT